jgi:hypothetical protein
VRTALGSANSDNSDQLGSKITTGISHQFENQAINKTEGLVSDKANTFLNTFDLGCSEMSIGGISTNQSLTHLMTTLQNLPLSKPNLIRVKTLVTKLIHYTWLVMLHINKDNT